jgi:F0F1-type ATP synthase membrane subunit c/vacuolar-type H+-ATPase subunit K
MTGGMAVTDYRFPLLMPRRSLLRAGTGLAVGSTGLGAALAQGAPAPTPAGVTSFPTAR